MIIILYTSCTKKKSLAGREKACEAIVQHQITFPNLFHCLRNVEDIRSTAKRDDHLKNHSCLLEKDHWISDLYPIFTCREKNTNKREILTRRTSSS